MPEKIEHIRARKLAIENDLNNPELMAKVLRYVWPEDGWESDYDKSFYNKTLEFNEKWIWETETQLPIVPASEILAWIENGKRDEKIITGGVIIIQLTECGELGVNVSNLSNLAAIGLLYTAIKELEKQIITNQPHKQD